MKRHSSRTQSEPEVETESWFPTDFCWRSSCDVIWQMSTTLEWYNHWLLGKHIPRLIGSGSRRLLGEIDCKEDGLRADFHQFFLCLSVWLPDVDITKIMWLLVKCLQSLNRAAAIAIGTTRIKCKTLRVVLLKHLQERFKNSCKRDCLLQQANNNKQHPLVLNHEATNKQMKFSKWSLGPKTSQFPQILKAQPVT